ncbi:MAG: hypothetical protein GY761_13595 [Hyphomicrobiales bacterium]|nr:hypothetical protein [Hyphomicrobiales bacterium]
MTIPRFFILAVTLCACAPLMIAVAPQPVQSQTLFELILKKKNKKNIEEKDT